MLQQTTVEKAEKRFGFLDNLFEDSNGKGELKKDTDFLSDDYAAAIRIAANLSSNAKWIPYPFLQNRIRKIADEMRTQSELFRSKISELGGQLPQVAVDNRDLLEFRQNVKRLVKDMEEHAADFILHVQKIAHRRPTRHFPFGFPSCQCHISFLLFVFTPSIVQPMCRQKGLKCTNKTTTLIHSQIILDKLYHKCDKKRKTAASPMSSCQSRFT